MIIKNLRCKQKSGITRLVDYVLSDKGRIENISDTFFIAHNMYAQTKEEFKAAFYENDTYRKKRKNGVVLYHEILSFSQKDQVTLDVVEDLTQKYIALRAPKAVVLAKPHVEEGHIHVHLLISGTEVCSSQVMRLDNKSFKKLRHDIEKYQQQQYPNLIHSIVYANKQLSYEVNKRDQKRRQERKNQAQKRMGRHKKLDKERLSIILQYALSNSHTKEQFISFIKSQDLLPYLYRGRINGVLYHGRKYRFQTLGIERTTLVALEQNTKNQPFIGSTLPHNLKQIHPWVGKEPKEQALARYKYQFQEYKQSHHLVSNPKLEKRRRKEIEVLVQNILYHSLTYKQFLFLARDVGFYTYDKNGQISGFKIVGKEYSFWKLGVLDQVIKMRKQQELHKNRSRKKSKNEGRSLF